MTELVVALMTPGVKIMATVVLIRLLYDVVVDAFRGIDMTQDTDYGTPSSMSALINKVNPFDEYIALKISATESAILIGDIDTDSMTGSGTLITAARTGANYGGSYKLTSKEVTNEPITLTNEYYCYSNVGLGQSYTVPQFSQITCAAVLIFVGAYIFTTFISGVLRYGEV